MAQELVVVDPNKKCHLKLCNNHPEGLSRKLFEHVIKDVIFGAETITLPI